ncbi:class I SAM-dependent methyltransferase [Roseicyclus amphidinii]|uniref:class I SAM-dependent methyltransferase n=1 Tax=Roseicyclus amphidinii TaxID=3034232 RepID=UPI0024E08FC2|nr:class I SAM-dependent methyltransferase [Roseicyclus sp. Amp-Y-6]
MSGWDPEAFFTVHADLPREGPGETADVAWAAEVAGLTSRVRILDAACGPGGDLGALLRVAARGHVTAIDTHAPFIEAARVRWGKDARVTLLTGDYLTPEGPFDFIWSAGAVYFVGIETALTAWRGALAEGGAIAFSEPCLFTDAPSEGAIAFWEGYARLTDAQGIAAQVTAAGFETVATRVISDIAWESYFRPMQDRLRKLRRGADARLLEVIAAHEAEIAGWRAHKAETGYLLSVVRPS